MDSSRFTLMGLGPAQVTLVVSSGCHFCHDAEDALDELGGEFPGGDAGRSAQPDGHGLAQRHGAAMSPLVLLDGAFVSAGRLPRNKLRKLLAQRRVRVGAVSR
jgi:glutaredoxin